MQAASKYLAPGPRKPRRPWISPATLELISARDTTIRAGDWGAPAPRNALIKRAAKKDRVGWVERTISESAWAP
eukprot:5607835-Alexandrium_andersonii.AAC.1